MLDIKEVMVEAHAHAVNAGFYEEGIPPLGLQIALMHSELSEALEADRKHLGEEAIKEEFADEVLRICDVFEARGWDLEKAISDKMEKNKGRGYKHGGVKY
jgi:hypothetical protein